MANCELFFAQMLMSKNYQTPKHFPITTTNIMHLFYSVSKNI